MGDWAILSGTSWEGWKWGSRQEIALRLARRGEGVLYVEPALGPEYLLSNPDAHGVRGLRQEAERLWVWTPPRVPPGRWFLRAINRWGQARVAAGLRRVVGELGFVNPVLWASLAYQADLVGRVPHRGVIYHYTDPARGVATGRRAALLEGMHRDLVRASGRVLVASRALEEECDRICPGRATRFPPGVDLNAFASAVPRLSGLPAPVLAVCGVLNDRIEWGWLDALLSEGVGTLLLLGTLETRSARVWVRDRAGSGRILAPGHIPHGEVAGWLAGSQVGLIPYRADGSEDATFPMKFWEYLAAGLPVATSPIPEVAALRDACTGWVHLGEGPEGFAQAVRNALAAPRGEPPAILAGQDWECRLDQVMGLLSAPSGQSVVTLDAEHTHPDPDGPRQD